LGARLSSLSIEDTECPRGSRDGQRGLSSEERPYPSTGEKSSLPTWQKKKAQSLIVQKRRERGKPQKEKTGSNHALEPPAPIIERPAIIRRPPCPYSRNASPFGWKFKRETKGDSISLSFLWDKPGGVYHFYPRKRKNIPYPDYGWRRRTTSKKREEDPTKGPNRIRRMDMFPFT